MSAPLVLETPPDAAAWDALAAESDGATVFHTSAWARVWTSEWPDSQWRALVVPEGSGYSAGLSVIVRRRVLGRVLLSMPYGTYGGPIVRRGHVDPPAARRRLLEEYARLSRGARVWAADLTWYQGNRDELPPEEIAETAVTHVRSLAPDFDALFRALPHSVRSRVRQAEEHGLVVERVTDREGVRAFHDLATRALGRRGAHAKSLSLYLGIFERLAPAGLARYDLVRHQGAAIAGSLHLLQRGVALNWLTVADPAHLDLRPNHLIIARLMRELCEAGYTEYDFGASPPDAEGLVSFKEAWGVTPRAALVVRRRSLVHRWLRG